VPSEALSTIGNAEFNIGFVGEATLGYGFRNGLKIEAEGDYLNDHIDGFTGRTLLPIGGDGTEEKYGFMGNVVAPVVCCVA
jgi:hypothetical protein